MINIKYFLNIGISEKRFRELLEEISIVSWGDISAEELDQRILKEISIKFSSEIFQKTLTTVPVKFPKISKKMLNTISDEIFKRVMKENPEDMCCYFLGLKFYQRMARRWSPYIILEHCFYQDILNNTVFAEEENVVYNNKMRAAELSRTSKNESIVIQKNNFRLYMLIKQTDCMF